MKLSRPYDVGRMKHRRSGRILRCGLFVAVVATLAAAAPAWAARVVDVRVGQHPGYSRLVFELDSPVGYKVERNAPAAGVNELVVSLDATSKAHTLKRRLDYIESVDIKPNGSRSTVRVRLKGDGLKLKEMILANPPRIVLDVLNEQAIAAAKASKKKASKRKASAKQAKKPAAKPKPVAAAQPAPRAKPQPPASMPVPAKDPRENRVVQSAKPAPKPAAKPPPPKPAPVAKPRAAKPAPVAKPAPRVKPPTAVPSAAVKPSGMAPKPTPEMPAARPAPKPAATARPKPPVPTPAAVTPPAADGGLFSLTNISVGAAGLVLLAGAAFVLVRRRRSSGTEEVDASAFENPLGDDNPFAGLDPSDDDVQAETEEIPISEAARAEVGIPIPDEEPETQVQEGNDMDMATDNSTTVLNPPVGAAMGGGDVSRMVAEFERRMAAMETRIDELVDAKERLERQVAAQTEELRVQRAAIARTQRAVRNLSRPGEDAPTEPALRDPSRPEGPRE